MIRLFLLCLLSFSLFACATQLSQTVKMTPAQISHLQQGKRFFDDGYYKRAMQELLPLACDGNPDAQYGVGYMYYYGLGVAQDTEVGYFWIQRAANQRYITSIKALERIDSKSKEHPLARKTFPE
jgi:TPR repeat protein